MTKGPARLPVQDVKRYALITPCVISTRVYYASLREAEQMLVIANTEGCCSACEPDMHHIVDLMESK